MELEQGTTVGLEDGRPSHKYGFATYGKVLFVSDYSKN